MTNLTHEQLIPDDFNSDVDSVFALTQLLNLSGLPLKKNQNNYSGQITNYSPKHAVFITDHYNGKGGNLYYSITNELSCNERISSIKVLFKPNEPITKSKILKAIKVAKAELDKPQEPLPVI